MCVSENPWEVPGELRVSGLAPCSPSPQSQSVLRGVQLPAQIPPAQRTVLVSHSHFSLCAEIFLQNLGLGTSSKPSLSHLMCLLAAFLFKSLTLGVYLFTVGLTS